LESISNFLNRLLPKGSAMRHVSILAGGTAVAQGLGIAVMPIISRIYSPADFGVMAVFASVTAILTELSGFRYHLAIPLPKQDRYAKALVVLSFLLQAVFVVFISIAILVLGKTILSKISMEVLIPYRYLIPVGVAGMGAYLALTQWAIREKLFQAIAKTRVTQSVSGILTKVILGLLGLKPLGLLLGSIVSKAGGITTLVRSIIKKKGIPKPLKEDIKRVASRYRKFPIFETWSGILNTMGTQIMPILLVVFFNPKVAGLFAMAQSLLLIPSVFVGQAIGQVFVQKASVARYEGTIKEVSLRAYSILFQLGLFPILILSLFAPMIFSFFLGEAWIEAGYFAQIIGPWVAFNFACSPMDVLFLVADIQGTRFLIEIIQNILRITVIVIGGIFGGAYWAVGLFSFVGLSVYIVKLFILLQKTGSSKREIFFKPLKKVFLSLGLIIPLLLSFLFKMPFLLQLILLIFSSALYFLIAYYTIVKKADY